MGYQILKGKSVVGRGRRKSGNGTVSAIETGFFSSEVSTCFPGMLTLSESATFASFLTLTWAPTWTAISTSTVILVWTILAWSDREMLTWGEGSNVRR